MRPKRVLDYLVYLIVRLFICFVQAIRLETGVAIADGFAWLACDVLRLRGKVVDENLRHAFPALDAGQRRRLARRMWRHLVLLILEVAHVPRKIHPTNWRKFVRVRNVEPLMRAFMENRPVVVVTGHFGNFEVGGYMLGLLGFPTHSVARTLDNAYVNDFLERFRGATGQHIIPKNGGYDQILEVLSRGGTMAFLADQSAGPKGCWVDFFGRPASTYKAIALLAMEHDAPIAVCYARRLDRPMQFEMVVSGMIDPRDTGGNPSAVKDLTQWYTHKLEEAIGAHPEQYWWVHRRWKDTRKEKARTAPKAAA
ncbi:MAG: lysophospholipid acyltransferase family protein [Thermoguttaceae bacterium]